MKRPLVDRFWSKVDKKSDDECWIWTGAKTPKGYGLIGIGKDSDGITYAHRLSFSMHHGEITIGMMVCHECDNPSCVNPKHLFIGTAKENTGDMMNKGRHRAGIVLGENHGKSKLTADDVKAIRSLGISQLRIAKLYGVSQSCIASIMLRKTWSHV